MLLCLPLMAAAQGHIKFLEMPVDGTPKAFGDKLVQKGYKFVKEKDNVRIYKGKFAGHEQAEICLFGADGLLYSVDVRLEKHGKWSDLYLDYTTIKDGLTKRYGTPVNCVEQFYNTKAEKNDAFRYAATVGDGCHYRTTFATEGGEVSVWIAHVGGVLSKPFVAITYLDAANDALRKKRAESDL